MAASTLVLIACGIVALCIVAYDQLATQIGATAEPIRISGILLTLATIAAIVSFASFTIQFTDAFADAIGQEDVVDAAGFAAFLALPFLAIGGVIVRTFEQRSEVERFRKRAVEVIGASSWEAAERLGFARETLYGEATASYQPLFERHLPQIDLRCDELWVYLHRTQRTYLLIENEKVVRVHPEPKQP